MKKTAKKTQAKKKAPAKKTAAKKRTAKSADTIGAFTKSCILAGKAVKEVEAAIREKFPNSGPQTNSIYFYRSQLHKTGELAK